MIQTMNRRLLPCCLLFLVGLALLGACAPRSHQVLLTVDGQRRFVSTRAATVGEALREVGIMLGPLDRVEPPSYTALRPNIGIVVRRVRERVVSEERPLAYERRIRRDATLAQGALRIQQLGHNGVERQTFLVRFEDGVETTRHLSATEVLTPAQAEILILGTRGGAGVPISGTLVYLAKGNAWLIRQQSHLKQALTRSGDLDGHVFSLSPDGRWLLFSRRLLGGEAGLGGPLNALWLVRVDVTNDEPHSLGINGVIWAEWQPLVASERSLASDEIAPERSYVFAYSSAERVPTPPGWKARNDLVQATVRPDGSLAEERTLLRARDGLYGWWGRTWTWAPDGLRLAWGGATALGTAGLDGRGERLFTFEPYETRGPWVWTPRPAWRPDGAGFVAVVHGAPGLGMPAGRSERFDLYFIPVRSGATERLAENVGMWALPAWSVQGRLAYGQAEDPATSVTSRYRVVVTDAIGAPPRVLFPADDRPGVDVPWLAWSPDGRQLITVWQGDLYLLDATGLEAPRALTVEGGASHPQWR